MYQVSSIKRIVSFLALYILLYTIYFTPPVFAHVLKTDGQIGAVLHIDPDDDPAAGQQSGFYFEFKDKTDKFKPKNCNCVFSILQGDKEIFTQPISRGNFFTFPEKDVYQIKVTGTPKTADSFQQFTLNYDVRVAKIATKDSSNSNTSGSSGIIGVVGILIAGFFIAAIIKRTKKTNVEK